MSSIETSQVEETLFVLCLLTLIASWVLRIRIFTKFGDFPIISELVRETSMWSFGDLLSVSLFRVRKRLPVESRLTVLIFIALYWSASVFMLLMFLSYGIRNWI